MVSEDGMDVQGPRGVRLVERDGVLVAVSRDAPEPLIQETVRSVIECVRYADE